MKLGDVVWSKALDKWPFLHSSNISAPGNSISSAAGDGSRWILWFVWVCVIFVRNSVENVLAGCGSKRQFEGQRRCFVWNCLAKVLEPQFMLLAAVWADTNN